MGQPVIFIKKTPAQFIKKNNNNALPTGPAHNGKLSLPAIVAGQLRRGLARYSNGLPDRAGPPINTKFWPCSLQYSGRAGLSANLELKHENWVLIILLIEGL